MKNINDMNAVEVSNFIVEIAPHMEQVLTSEKLNAAMEDFHLRKEKNPRNAGVRLIMDTVFALVHEENRASLFAILGALYGVSAEEISQRNGLQIVKDVRKLLKTDFTI